MRRWLSFIARPVIRIGAFLATKLVLIIAVVLISLSFSISSFVVPALASGMWRAAAWMFGPPAVATVTETQRLRQQNKALQRSSQDLQIATARQAQASAMLRDNNQRLTFENRQLRDQVAANGRITASTARRIGQRAVFMSTRSVASIPLESLPVLGVATIIATTAWDIRDTCDTLHDMAEIQRHLGQEPDSSFAARACDSVPLQAARVGLYGEKPLSVCRADATAARNRILMLADQARASAPDLLVEENDFDAEIIQAANYEFEAINAICDCIADLLCDPQAQARR